MTRRERIIDILTETFSPQHLVVEDFSAEHAGHASAPDGGESHFRVHIAATQFANTSRVACHRMIYDALGDEMQHGIHALQIDILPSK